VVCHPVIDGCMQLRSQHSLSPEQIAAVALRVHRLALELTGIKAPRSGLESKWSLYHSAAVAIVDNAAGEHQYTDERVHDPVVSQLRECVTAEADTGLREDEAYVVITLRDGQILGQHIEHAIGSIGHPMSDRDLERKFLALPEDVLSKAQVDALIEKCWQAARLDDVAVLARLAVPATAPK
jgi:2-methylcitrate dehydratase PrpD